MNKKIRTIGLCTLLVIWALLSVLLWFGPKQDYTNAERRKLAQLPKLSTGAVFSGKFMPDFEDFTLDQFPLRDTFRQIKSLFHYYVLNQADNNGIYLVGDTVAKIEYPFNETSLNYATGRLQYLHELYLKNTACKIYSAMIPDKGYYLAEPNGYPAMDYDAMEAAYRAAMPWAEYVDLKDFLNGSDYYHTDTHWRQERILDVADALCTAMGVEALQETDYSQVTAEPFYGVYFGQAALPMNGEVLVMLQNEMLQSCTVTDPITGTLSEVYNFDKRSSPDLYDMYLSGAQPLLVIENPAGQLGKELVLFRDSYGSSLAPLLLADYSRVTLVDIRYISPDQIESYVNFDDQDVLFLYSTLILNNGRSLK